MQSTYRCKWASKYELEKEYHDNEWGIPVSDDNLHFEMLTLESAQSGLSWHTILVKRENYREAFLDFDIKKVSLFTSEDVQTLLENKGIVRHKLKIESTINNAKAILKIQEEFGSFNSYIWSFVNFIPINNARQDQSEIPSSTALSTLISKDLKKRGFKFLGTTTVYAYMQAMGMVNDHVKSCFCYEQTLKKQEEFKKLHNTK